MMGAFFRVSALAVVLAMVVSAYSAPGSGHKKKKHKHHHQKHHHHKTISLGDTAESVNATPPVFKHHHHNHSSVNVTPRVIRHHHEAAAHALNASSVNANATLDSKNSPTPHPETESSTGSAHRNVTAVHVVDHAAEAQPLESKTVVHSKEARGAPDTTVQARHQEKGTPNSSSLSGSKDASGSPAPLANAIVLSNSTLVRAGAHLNNSISKAKPGKHQAHTAHAIARMNRMAAKSPTLARRASVSTNVSTNVSKNVSKAKLPQPHKEHQQPLVAAAPRRPSQTKSAERQHIHSHHDAATKKVRGELLVNGPLPPDFEDRFVEAAAEAAGVPPSDIQVLSVTLDNDPDVRGANIDKVVFLSSEKVVATVENEAGDAESLLANGPLRIFLMDRTSEALGTDSEQRQHQRMETPGKSEEDKPGETEELRAEEPKAEIEPEEDKPEEPEEQAAQTEEDETEETEEPRAPRAVRDRGFDIDGEMPYGDLEPFGREDTAQELTESSIHESDEMVDQLERAEVAEEKRAVFRALTRLRGAAITSFDGIARSQTGNIDEYNKRYKWRESHPLHHLADEESDVRKWAFPEGEDC